MKAPSKKAAAKPAAKPKAATPKAAAAPKAENSAAPFKHSRAAHHTTIPVDGGEKVVQEGDYVVERDGAIDVIPASVFEAEHPDLALPLEAKED